ncbi:MAG: hypothetical protein KAY22_16960 [Rhizorhabdus sp.]|uniref:hypothetical protein n=1 Tax=Rhizorhabdus sp. TaxID=1968843 RepID=UPI001B47267F|nr:hypothetical protein [Rhizorhabdus sp.]MBP8233990.1 hypothetical protein [Rhizorhabdus sp.]
MKAKYITGNTVLDLGTDVPFVANNTVVAINPNTSTARTVQFGASAAGPFSTGVQPDGSAAIVPAGGAIEVVLRERYAAIEAGAGTVILLAN